MSNEYKDWLADRHEEYWVAQAECKKFFPSSNSFYVSEDEDLNYIIVLNENNEGIIFERGTWKSQILHNLEAL